jgi:hypothetical protein
MRSADFSFVTNKIFEKKFNHERGPKEQGTPILDISALVPWRNFFCDSRGLEGHAKKKEFSKEYWLIVLATSL